MRTTLVTTGLGGIVAAAAAAGPTVLAGLAVFLFASFALSCWVIANRDRTANTVAIIAAARGGQPELRAGPADAIDPGPQSP